MADETINFYMNYFVDRVYGEVYPSTRENGNTNETTKASYWKAGYHSIELGYYLYLYTNLFVHSEDVNLYYNFSPFLEDREIILTPLAIEDEKLEIKSITLDGESYTNYEASSRTLIIPKNVGGIFNVEFGISETTDIVNIEVPNKFNLYQNYPNPFNPSTNIKFDLYEAGNVEINVYDILGNKVKTLENSYYKAGSYSIRWNANNNNNNNILAGGVYLISIKHNNNIKTIRAILLK
jgi:hypothetical protein